MFKWAAVKVKVHLSCLNQVTHDHHAGPLTIFQNARTTLFFWLLTPLGSRARPLGPLSWAAKAGLLMPWLPEVPVPATLETRLVAGSYLRTVWLQGGWEATGMTFQQEWSGQALWMEVMEVLTKPMHVAASVLLTYCALPETAAQPSPCRASPPVLLTPVHHACGAHDTGNWAVEAYTARQPFTPSCRAVCEAEEAAGRGRWGLLVSHQKKESDKGGQTSPDPAAPQSRLEHMRDAIPHAAPCAALQAQMHSTQPTPKEHPGRQAQAAVLTC